VLLSDNALLDDIASYGEVINHIDGPMPKKLLQQSKVAVCENALLDEKLAAAVKQINSLSSSKLFEIPLEPRSHTHSAPPAKKSASSSAKPDAAREKRRHQTVNIFSTKKEMKKRQRAPSIVPMQPLDGAALVAEAGDSTAETFIRLPSMDEPESPQDMMDVDDGVSAPVSNNYGEDARYWDEGKPSLTPAAFDRTLEQLGPEAVEPYYWVQFILSQLRELAIWAAPEKPALSLASNLNDEAALETLLEYLSRGLEAHKNSPLLWYTFLRIYGVRMAKNLPEMENILQQATALCPQVSLFWERLMAYFTPSWDVKKTCVMSAATNMIQFSGPETSLKLMSMLFQFARTGCEIASPSEVCEELQQAIFALAPNQLAPRHAALLMIVCAHVLAFSKTPHEEYLRFMWGDSAPILSWKGAQGGIHEKESLAALFGSFARSTLLGESDALLVVLNYVAFMEVSMPGSLAGVLEEMTALAPTNGVLLKIRFPHLFPVTPTSEYLRLVPQASFSLVWACLEHSTRISSESVKSRKKRVVSPSSVVQIVLDAVIPFATNFPPSQRKVQAHTTQQSIDMTRKLYARLLGVSALPQYEVACQPLPDTSPIEYAYMWKLLCAAESLSTRDPGEIAHTFELGLEYLLVRFDNWEAYSLLWSDYFLWQKESGVASATQLVGMLGDFVDIYKPKVCALVDLRAREILNNDEARDEAFVHALDITSVDSFEPLNNAVAAALTSIPSDQWGDLYWQILRIHPHNIDMAFGFVF
jgi:hypothetical protein